MHIRASAFYPRPLKTGEDLGEYGYLPSLAIKSASITGQPKSANMRETVLFPEAIPPVTATRNILTKKIRFTNDTLPILFIFFPFV